MPNSSDAPVNVFIQQSDLDKNVMKGKQQDAASSYIIYQNNHLLKQYHDIVQSNTELEREKEELETYNDRLERTKICLQGYVRNEHDTNQKYAELSRTYVASLEQYNKVFLMSHAWLLIYIAYCVYASHSILVLMCLLLMFSAHIYMNYTNYIAIQSKCNSPRMKELIEAIDKTKKSNVYIDDLIDNI